jgi:hypothetical protein
VSAPLPESMATRDGDGPRARSAPWRLCRCGAARGTRNVGSCRAGSRSCCMTVRSAPLTRSLRSSDAPGCRAAACEPRTPPRAGSSWPDSDVTRHRQVIDAFLAASRGGDFDALLELLDPDLVLRADPSAVRAGASKEVSGAVAVAGTFSGRARFAQPALVDGAAGPCAPCARRADGQPRVVFGFTFGRGKIVAIDLVADPERLEELNLAILDE